MWGLHRFALVQIGDGAGGAADLVALGVGLVANLLGCTEQTIRSWEQDKCRPQSEQMAKPIEFLGYDPLPEPVSLGEQLMRDATPATAWGYPNENWQGN